MEPWDKMLMRKLMRAGFTHEQAGMAVGEVAEHRQQADREGYERGYLQGGEHKKAKPVWVSRIPTVPGHYLVKLPNGDVMGAWLWENGSWVVAGGFWSLNDLDDVKFGPKIEEPE